MSSTEETNPIDSPETSGGESKDQEKQGASTDYFRTNSAFIPEDNSQQSSPFEKPIKDSSVEFNNESSSENLTIADLSEGDSVEPEDGGESTLLSGKLTNWLKENNFQFQRIQQPLLIAAAVIAVLLALQVYGSFLGTISRVPIAPRLFQLVGFLWIGFFAVTRLVRSKDRQEVFTGLVDRWKTFSGGEKISD